MRTGGVAAWLVLVFSCLGTGATCGAPAVRLATLEWEPYIGEQLPEQGYVAALVRAAYAERGIEVEISFYPWARALHLARTGEVDGLLPEYFDASREAEFEFSAAFPGGPLGLYKRRDAQIRFGADPHVDPEAALRSLAQYRFGVVRGYLNTPVFDAADYLLKDAANSDEINLRKLAFGRVDLVVIDSLVAAHLLRTHLPAYADQLEFLPPALEDKPLYIAFSRKSPQAATHLAEFNSGLAALVASGRVAALRQRLLPLSRSAAP